MAENYLGGLNPPVAGGSLCQESQAKYLGWPEKVVWIEDSGGSTPPRKYVFFAFRSHIKVMLYTKSALFVVVKIRDFA